MSSPSIQSDLQITTEREAENGQGTFQTLALTSRKKMGTSRKALAHQRRKLELYLQQLQAESALSVLQPMSSETALISRYINMLGPWTASKQPLSVLGTWIHSIPSRIGHNRMMDLAVDFLIKSYEVYWDNTYTKRGMARTSKERALKELQLFVNNGQNRPTYEVVLVTKMHYAAEVCCTQVKNFEHADSSRLYSGLTQCTTRSMLLDLLSCSNPGRRLSSMWMTSISGT